MDHDDASRVRGNRANVEVALDRVANLAEPGAQSASYEDESLIHGNSTATSPDLTRAVGDSQAMVSGPDTPAARENSDGHRNSPRKMLQDKAHRNSDDTTKPHVVFKATQVTKIGTEHPRMWHHVMAR